RAGDGNLRIVANDRGLRHRNGIAYIIVPVQGHVHQTDVPAAVVVSVALVFVLAYAFSLTRRIAASGRRRAHGEGHAPRTRGREGGIRRRRAVGRHVDVPLREHRSPECIAGGGSDGADLVLGRIVRIVAGEETPGGIARPLVPVLEPPVVAAAAYPDAVDAREATATGVLAL